MRRDVRCALLLACCCAAALLTGCGGTGVSAGSPAPSTGGSTTWAGLVSCSRAIVWGDVLEAAPASGPGRVRVKLRVTEWVKPDAGPATAEYDLVDPEANGGKGVNRPFVVGEHMMLRVPVDVDEMVTGHYGADAIFQGGELMKAVPDAPASCGPTFPGG